MKRITLFIGSLRGGGAERVTCNLANDLCRKGYEIEVLTMSDAADTYKLDNAIKKTPLIRQSERKNLIYDFILRYSRLGRYMKDTDVDCYIVMLPVTIAMMLMQKRKTKASIIASERNDPNSYSEGMKWLQRTLAGRADGFVFQTKDAEAWYGDAVTKIQTAVIPNAINPAFIRTPYSGEREKVIAGVGRLTGQKNFSVLINAFAEIADQFPDYNLVIYGEGEKRAALQEQIDRLGLTTRVSLPGSIQNIAEEMEKNTAFVLSSDFEGMPNALMEAMALGLPCISTDCPCGGPRFLIRDGENGLLVPPNDTKAMAAALKSLLESKALRETLASHAQEIKDTLSPDIIYDRWEQFIRTVAEK